MLNLEAQPVYDKNAEKPSIGDTSNNIGYRFVFNLVASLFIILFTQIDYFVPYHYGTQVIDVPLFVRLGIIGFGLFVFFLVWYLQYRP